MTVRGDFSKLRKIEQTVRDLPRVVGVKVATAIAQTITGLARKTFDAGENAYGDTWQPGAHGQKVTLRRSGALARFSYVATGTRLRSALGPRWARFQVGKRGILPRSKLPIAYVQALRAKTNEVIQRELG
jgi:hypothetical protein